MNTTSAIFLGTPSFGATVLEDLIKDNYQVSAVVTQPDKEVGRKQKLTSSPVKEMAQEYDLPVYQPARLPKSEELDTLINLHTDLIIAVAYGQFLSTKFLKDIKIAAVNVHGLLLPKYRSGVPTQYSLISGDEETGVTIMEMVEEMDVGDMYAQEKLLITPEDITDSLFGKMAILGRDLLLKTLSSTIDGNCSKKTRDTTKVVFSPNISKDQEGITKGTTVSQVHNLIRSLSPDSGTYLMINGQRMRVWSSEVTNETTRLPIGALVDNHKRFAVSFANHTVLNLTEIQPTGEKKMADRDYMNGRSASLKLEEVFIDD